MTPKRFWVLAERVCASELKILRLDTAGAPPRAIAAQLKMTTEQVVGAAKAADRVCDALDGAA